MSEILDSFFIDFSNGWMDVEVSWPASNFMEKLGENIARHSSFGSPEGGLDDFIDFELVLFELVELIRNNFFVVSFICLGELILKSFKASRIDNSLFDQFL